MSYDTYFKVKGVYSKFKISIAMPVADRIFSSTHEIKFNVIFDNTSNEQISGKFTAYVISDFNDTISTVKSTMQVGKKKKFTLPIALKKVSPGFYKFEYSLTSSGYNTVNSVNFGVDPEKIISPVNNISDLENFWMRAKRELAAVDPQFKLIRQDSLCTDKPDVFLVEMRSLENVLIRGWYARPKAAGKYPSILHVQGYSSNQQMSWGYKESDMAVFVLNVRGHGNSKDNVNPGFPGYLQYNIKDKEKYIYRGAYMDCLRAVDFLCSLSEVDTTKIVVAGGSQGGALSIATAALDNKRIKLCMPDVPFLSDFPDYFKVAKWPADEFSEFVKKNPTFGWQGVFETLKYFDIKNLAPWVKCPVLMQVGLKDTTCPPHINFAAFNQLNVPKSYVVYPESGHGLPSQADLTKYAWIKEKLGMNR
jgi:cephalosporin-C deacetylase-like acetyl esterase